jgi:PAS domain S-box-containing protein
MLQRLLANHRRAMLSHVVNDSFDGIVIVDQAGVVKLCNPAACLMLGRTDAEMVDRPVASFISGLPLDRDGNLIDRDAAMLTIVRDDGTTVMLEVVVSVSRSASARASQDSNPEVNCTFILTFRDVTERQRVEEQKRLAMERAIAADRAKSEFLANMSHELRTPLNAIIGFSEVMEGEMFGPIGVPQYKNYVSDIMASGRHLLAIINDILDMSKIEAGEMKLSEEAIEPATLIASTMRLIEGRAFNAKVGVSAEVDADLPRLWGDSRMIRQCLLNLLSNAVKFTPKGGSISVIARRDRSGSLVLAVRDTGIGMNDADLERAMAPFGQVDSRLERKYEGTGLGLPLTKRMMDLHGGSLKIESRPNAGTTASLCFPPARIIAAPAAKATSAVA